ncbi:MAG: asparagine synthase-related protein [Alteraurantiacibacter sp. bin_em_oilr2.035]|nr:asparagine synthase-related protein [Alteraurantiacibacter sp. bin_em_oilr2.035]
MPSLEGLCGDVPQLWIAEGTHVADLGSAGWVIGPLFSGSTAQRVSQLPQAGTHSARTIAADLAANFWGAYLAILPDRDRSDLAVLPDPSGLVPIYRLATTTHVVLTSDPKLFEQTCGERIAISCNSLARFLMRAELRARRTCLTGVDELRPGVMTYPAESDPEEIPVWHAAQFLPGKQSLPYDEAKAQLREMAIRVMGAWANELGPVAVAVSGGVDSSLVCAALARAQKPFSCITLATSDRSGDERDYARLLAEHLGAAYAERIYDPVRFDPQISASAGLPRPSRRSFLSSVDELLAGAAGDLGAQIVFDGNAGDNLFCFLHSAAPVVDRLRVEGVRRGAGETFLDMCRVTGCDLPTMVQAVAKRLVRRPHGAWPCDQRLLADHLALDEALDPVTSWLQTDVGRHGGKRDHLALIMRAQNHVHGLGVGPERFSPLVSQPLLEFCLGIPTWLWVKGGRNRALARDAFTADLPQSLLTRTSKSGPDSFIRLAFHHHRSALRELLLDGLLDQHGLLNRASVEAAFQLDTSLDGSTIYRLLDLAEAETWARSWH